MAPRKIVFWEVDAQADFMLPGGKLYVPGAEKIIPNIQRLVDAAIEARHAARLQRRRASGRRSGVRALPAALHPRDAGRANHPRRAGENFCTDSERSVPRAAERCSEFSAGRDRKADAGRFR